MPIAILLWVVCGFFAAMVATNRGANGALWFGLGVLLGPFGLAMSFAAGETKPCPHCGHRIPARADRCPKCTASLASNGAEAYPVDSEDRRTRHLVDLLEGRAIPVPPRPAAPAGKICPDCAETVLPAARKCRFCGYRFDATGEM